MTIDVLTTIGDTIYYFDDDSICIESVTDIHITKNNIWYNTNSYIVTFSNDNYNIAWFTDIKKATDAYHTKEKENAIQERRIKA